MVDGSDVGMDVMIRLSLMSAAAAAVRLEKTNVGWFARN
jgi:hypothetical protein